MALINCPECTKQISSHAQSCPDCGYPMDEKENQKSSSDDISEIKKLAKTNKIKAIKLYRDLEGCTLKEAKDFVDKLTGINSDSSSKGNNKSAFIRTSPFTPFRLFFLIAILIICWFLYKSLI
jgi:ribosomal protein L7/L12